MFPNQRTFLILFIVLLVPGTNLLAQKAPGIIAGNILDASNQKALPQATVVLRSMKDSLLQYAVISDKNGGFQIQNIPFGYYQLTISAIGYRSKQLDSIHFRMERYDFNLGDLLLSTQTQELTEVVIYAEKPLIESKEGNLIFNVGESAMSNGSTATELLKQTPLVTTDPNGKILVRGKEPRILIDDKPVELTMQQMQDLLESMPGSNIEKIEVLTNPPPQYANEQGGVINIVTKKGKIGFSSRFNVSGGTRGEASSSINLNYRKQGFALNLNAGTGYNRFEGDGYSNRTNIYTDSSNQLNIQNSFLNKNYRPNFRLNMDYEYDKRNLFNMVAQLNENLFDNIAQNRYTNINRFNAVSRLSEREIATTGENRNSSINFTYTHKGKKPGEQLRIITAVNYGVVNNNRNFFQEFLTVEGLPSGTDSTQKQINHTINHGFQANLSYDKQLSNKKTSFSTGAAYYRTNSSVDLATEFFKKPEFIFQKVELLSNRFQFHQDVINIRASFKHIINAGFSISAGASLEQTNILFELFKENRSPYNRYFNFLPFANFNRNWQNKTNLSFSYRRTIRRPGINELNPAIDYADPYNIRYGNPELEPTLAHTFDLVAGKTKERFFFNIGTGFNLVENIFSQIRSLQGDGKTIVTWNNVSSRKEYEVSGWGGLTISKKLRMNVSASYSYNVYGAFDKTIRKFRDGGSFTSNLNGNFTPTDVLTFTINGTFNRLANPQGTFRSNVHMNLGVQRKLLKKKIILTFNAIDPFVTQQNRLMTNGSNFILESVSLTQTRNFRLSISYVFSKTKTISRKPDLLKQLPKK